MRSQAKVQNPETKNPDTSKKFQIAKIGCASGPNRIAADDKQKRDEAAWPKFTEKPARLPHMHEKCLHPAFVS